jgi:carbon storage regulator
MLVLSRKKGEDVLIPQHDIVITVLEARNGKVRLGIKAPDDVKIVRRELHDKLTSSGSRHDPGILAGSISRRWLLAPGPDQRA